MTSFNFNGPDQFAIAEQLIKENNPQLTSSYRASCDIEVSYKSRICLVKLPQFSVEEVNKFVPLFKKIAHVDEISIPDKTKNILIQLDHYVPHPTFNRILLLLADALTVFGLMVTLTEAGKPIRFGE